MAKYLPVAAILFAILIADFFSHDVVKRESFDDRHGVLSPDGVEIAFESDRDGHLEIYVMNADGSSVRRLTVIPAGGENSFPRWSPDGEWIMYQSRKSDRHNWQLHMTKPDGSETKILSKPENSDRHAVFSPDGKQIAFISSRKEDLPGEMHIYVMKLDGTEEKRLTQLPFEKHSPSWSPDGRRLLYSARNEPGNLEIFEIWTDGSRFRQITKNPAYDCYQPAWSSDGSRIAFVTNRNGRDEIYFMNADGTRQVQMTKKGSFNSYRPFWSADGEKLIFDSDRAGALNLYSINIDGRGLSTLTKKPESAFIAFVKDQGVDRAKEVFEQTMKEDHGKVMFKERELLALGYSYLEAEQPEDAEQLFKIGVSAYPTPRCYSALAHLRKMKNEPNAVSRDDFFRTIRLQGLDKAEEVYKKVRSESPKWIFFDAREMQELGRHYFLQKRYDAARRVFELVIDSYPRSPIGYFGVAQVYLKERNKDEALKNLTMVMQVDPTDREAARLVKNLTKK